MASMTYPHMSENRAALVRAAHGGFARIVDDVPNFRLLIEGQPFEYHECHDYIVAWRDSGLWTLPGHS